MIPVDQIRPNPDQPRKALGDLRELTDSIREKGVLEPLLVRYVPREDAYHIISGERRYHAARAAGFRAVAALEEKGGEAGEVGNFAVWDIYGKDFAPVVERGGLHRPWAGCVVAQQ